MERAPDAVATAFRTLLPPDVAVATAAVSARTEGLLPAEAAAATGMAPLRRAGFAAGRHCARRALHDLGAEPVAIPVGPARAPRFPPGFCGSITHAGGIAAAAVRRGGAPLGIDLEEAADLPDEVFDRVCAVPEAVVAPAGLGAGLWGRVVFSAKESVYKCLAPAVGRFIDFAEVRVASVTGNRIVVAPATDAPDLAPVTGIEVRFGLREGLVLTAAWR